MRALVFDASTIISMAMNNLLWILDPLKKAYKGKFYIPLSVKKEVIDRPLKSKRFKLEALQVLSKINKGVIEIYDDKELKPLIQKLDHYANNMLETHHRSVHIVHKGEIAALALVVHLQADALVIDERTLRVIIENPKFLSKLMKKKMHTSVFLKKKNVDEFHKAIGNVKVLRSVELAVMAYELGLFSKYKLKDGIVDIHAQKVLLDGLLWALKLHGCSIADKDIDEILRIEGV